MKRLPRAANTVATVALLLLLLTSATALFGQAWSGILPSNRAIDWTNAGVSGGIPSGSWANCVNTACNTAFSTPTAANINTACAGAPNNTVVRMPAGAISGAIHCNRSNVVLRGAGPTQTTITGSVLLGNGTSGQGSTPSGLGTTTFSTLTQGSTVLTVGSTTGLSAGQVIALMQSNPGWVVPLGNEGNENATWCAPASLNFFGCSAHSASELVLITNVNSGASQITIDAPGLSQTYSAGLSPIIVYWSTTGVTSLEGVENLTVDATLGSFDVSLVFCNSCWVKNVSVIHIGRAGVYNFFGYRDEIRDSYISASNTPGAPTEYGIEVDRSALTKIENVILFGITSPTVIESSYGIVLGYNYTLNTATDNVFPTLDTHRSHSYDMLYEGNVTSKVDFDFVWGSASHNTVFRTYSRGTDPNKGNYRTPIALDSTQRYINVVGNVLGDLTISTSYVCDATVTSVDHQIYDVGGFNGCGTTPYDSLVETSLMRWGNWDAVTWKANGNTNGIRFCTGSGAGNAACTAPETANSDPTFPGLASPSTTFPASFYTGVTAAHASCGTGLSFWKNPSSGFCPAYPPIGPDVACSTNCNANTATHASMIPAQLCYNNTTKNGSGFLTAFDADSCYAADAAGPPQASTPSFSPGAGTYIGSQSVTITSSSGGAIICYNTTGSPATNGTTGCTTGTLYSGPVTVSVNSTLFAAAGGTGFTDSTVASANYNFVVPPQNGVGSSLGAISH